MAELSQLAHWASSVLGRLRDGITSGSPPAGHFPMERTPRLVSPKVRPRVEVIHSVLGFGIVGLLGSLADFGGDLVGLADFISGLGGVLYGVLYAVVVDIFDGVRGILVGSVLGVLLGGFFGGFFGVLVGGLVGSLYCSVYLDVLGGTRKQ